MPYKTVIQLVVPKKRAILTKKEVQTISFLLISLVKTQQTVEISEYLYR
jgi:hypothetical protein